MVWDYKKTISLLLARFVIILLYLAQSCTWQNSVATLTCVFSGTKRVESSAHLMSSLFPDNVFKSCAKTKNNVGPRPEPCTKPRLKDSNFETTPLKRQTCWRGDRNLVWMYIGLSPGDFVSDGDAILPPQKKRHNHPHPIFAPCLLWPNGWMDEDATWYGSRPRPRPLCFRRVPSYSRNRHSSHPPSFRPMSIVSTVAYLSYC